MNQISKTILSAVDYNNSSALGSRLRRRRRGAIQALIDDVYSSKGSVRLLDLGGQRPYWNIFDSAYLKERRVKITLLNYDPNRLNSPNEPDFESVIGDACDLNYDDGAFDIVHSNSTIEHVGDWRRMEDFATQTRRLGRKYYVQTPYYFFPVEPHVMMPFFHWLPEGLRAKMLVRSLVPQGGSADLGHAMRRIQGARLLDRNQFQYLFPDARVHFEWVGPFPKSLIAVRS